MAGRMNSYQSGSTDQMESGLRDEEADLSTRDRRNGLVVRFIVVAAALGVAVFMVSAGNSLTSSPLLSKFSSIEPLAMAASNEYGDSKATKMPYPFLENALFAEPYKTAQFEVTNPMSGCEYSWQISSPSGDALDSGVSDDGSFSSTAFEAVGEYSLSVSESGCDDSSYARTYSTSVWVKYVRRELMTLTDADRETFLNAFSTLWKVNTVDGKALYGENYKSLYFFASIHNDAGANSACDEFHGDQGFVNNHMMLGAYLEQSLQLVDPTTCLHYLEYGQYFESDAFDSHLQNQYDGGAWTPILSATWFGSSDPVTGRILDGRWENASVPLVTDQFYVDHGIDKDQLWFPSDAEYWTGADIHVTSPYGLLRSPWNWNPEPYVARYNNIHLIQDISYMDPVVTSFYDGVTCSDFDSFMTGVVYGQPLYNFLHFAEDSIHGQIHFTFGGAGGSYANEQNAVLKSDYAFDDIDLILLAGAAQTFVKRSYPVYLVDGYEQTFEDRFNGAEFPFTCTTLPWDLDTQTLWTTDVPGEPNAMCTFNSEYYCASQERMNQFYLYFLADYQNVSAPPLCSLEKALKALDLEDQCAASEVIVKRAAFDGEMAGSGAAMDPLFWVAHGAVERLLQKVIFENVSSDLIYDADKAHCSGHTNTGTKYWLTGYYFEDPTVVTQDLTNVQLTEIMNPATDHYRDYFNFVYDTGSYDFCSTSDAWFAPTSNNVRTPPSDDANKVPASR